MILRRGPLAGLELKSATPTLTIVGICAAAKTIGMVLTAWGLASAIAAIADGWAPSPGSSWASTPGLSAAAIGVGARAVAGWISETAAARMAVGFEHELRERLLHRTLRDPTVSHGGRSLLATSRLDAVRPYLSRYLPALMSTAVIPLLIIVWLLYTDLLTGIIVALTVPLVPLFLALIGMHTAERTARATKAVNVLAHHVTELVRGLPALVGLGRAHDQAHALKNLSRRVRHRTVTLLRTVFLSSLALELLATMSVALVAVTVGLRLVHGHLDLHTGLLLLVLAPEAYAPFRTLGAAHHASEEGREAVTHVRALLNEPEGQPLPASPDSHEPENAIPVTVTGLTVSHHERTGNQVNDLNLTLQPGTVTLLDGPSGAGKTTVLATLTGRRTTDSASISGTLQGLNREKLAVLDQHPTFTAATASDEVNLHTSSEKAAAALSELGLDVIAHHDPHTFSPGQKQLLAVARALARIDAEDANVLLLDEPTAHLDPTTAATAIAAIGRRTPHTATLLITHDPNCRALAHHTISLDTDQPTPAAHAPRAQPSTHPSHDNSPVQTDETPQPSTGIQQPLIDRPTQRKLAIAVLLGIGAAAAAIALTATSAWLIVRAAEQPPLLTLMVAIVGVRAFGLTRALLRWAERVASHSAVLSNMEHLRLRLWDALTRRGPAVTDRAGEHATTYVIGDLDRYQEQLLRTLMPPLVTGGAALVAITIMGAILPPAGIILALAVVTALLGTAMTSRTTADDTSTRLRSELENRVITAINGSSDIYVHRAQSPVMEHIKDVARQRVRHEQRQASANGIADAIVTLSLGLAAIAAVAIGVTHVADGAIAATALAVIALTPLALIEPLTSIGPSLRARRELRTTARRLRTVVELSRPSEPAQPTSPKATIRELHLANVAVGWPGGLTIAHGINMRATPHRWTMITGPSGSGKSTTLATLLGFLRPRAGRYIQVDSGDTATDTTIMLTDDIRSSIAWCPQEANIFDGTVKANLALSQPRGSLTGPKGERRMRAVLHQVRLDGLVDSLPDGLNTRIGPGGRTLSGGERRRLAIARALLTDRPVLVLDEPAAHVDAVTAHHMLSDLRETVQDRTVIVVTHHRGLISPGDTEVRLSHSSSTPHAETALSSVLL